MAIEPKVSACLVTRGDVDMQPVLDEYRQRLKDAKR